MRLCAWNFDHWHSRIGCCSSIAIPDTSAQQQGKAAECGSTILFVDC